METMRAAPSNVNLPAVAIHTQKRFTSRITRPLSFPCPSRTAAPAALKCHSSARDSPPSNPLKVLGLPHDCTLDEIKTAFRLKVKEFHPDVYKGEEDAGAITQMLIEAYEVLSMRVSQSSSLSSRERVDPFDCPECVAQDVFVNEFECIGRSCPYSCVKTASNVFAFASETGCARAVVQAPRNDYQVQVAVGQCPRNCIYYVTPMQRDALQRILERALERVFDSSETALLESLLAKAKFENGRYTPSKRKARTSTEWVDWY